MRQNTVYDLTSLRLHPDGTRVLQTESNRRLRVSKQSVLDLQGNWIASDAGGSGRVTRYRTLRQEGKEREESASVEDYGEKEQHGAERQEEEPFIKDSRAIKRRKFQHDFDFISPSPIHQYAGRNNPEEEESSVFPLPSSDLLKLIHYMTSQFYHEKGQLLNASREYREQRKLRRLEKLSSKTLDKPEESDDSQDSTSESGKEKDGVSGKNDQNEREMSDEGQDDMDGGRAKGGETKKKRKRGDRNPIIDMYRTMNGSALMALGAFMWHDFLVDLSNFHHDSQECSYKSILQKLSNLEYQTTGKLDYTILSLISRKRRR
ncbi:hypothetical protein L218DRAFT_1045498 [Marasmius fiardii PR-910]|nr:hypothetical protein L218DRAFT_1045498 [Marasmius fiardii PR-910]